MFNEIIEVPLCGLNANTKRAIAERNEEAADGSALKDPYYMASSPHANYDQGRNKRAIADAEERVNEKKRTASQGGEMALGYE